MRLTRWSLVVVFAAFCAHGADLRRVQYVGKTKYLNNARAVVTHSIDDLTEYVRDAVDAMDRHGIKATIFASTAEDPPPGARFAHQLQAKKLWPRLREAIENGHEVGAHSRTHPCPRPGNEEKCQAAYTDGEVSGSRDDILAHTQQGYVWTWCYPCGVCAGLESIQKRVAAAGMIVARNYPDEPNDGHLVPDLQTWAANPYDAAYTQVVQKRGGAAKTAILDVNVLNGKFDEVYRRGGIYSFVSHPQWLEYGPDGFYEKHLRYIGRRHDVWYAPMGHLYAYKTIHERTEVRPLSRGNKAARFAVSNSLDRKVYSGSVTMEFIAPAGTAVISNKRVLPERRAGATDRWNEEYVRREGDRLFVTASSNTTLEFR